MAVLNRKGILSAFCAVTTILLQFILPGESLKVLELRAPYKIRSAGNGRYLTASQQGIVGLKTGMVTTKPYYDRQEQQWNLSWDPTLDDNHDGYRLESRMEYLNQVTTYYPDGSTEAMPNIWDIIELKSGARLFRNKRTRKCLQVMPTRPEVTEKTCSIQNRYQHWIMELLDINMTVGGKKYRIRTPYWQLEQRLFDLESEYDDEMEAEDDDTSGSSEDY